mmetsp:Transcript_19113/g.53968  ORF Transcript_19113/g.53968 Transcript_19113/m.53968 type:complete len:212 (-) Transcript_19113:86-721(-)
MPRLGPKKPREGCCYGVGVKIMRLAAMLTEVRVAYRLPDQAVTSTGQALGRAEHPLHGAADEHIEPGSLFAQKALRQCLRLHLPLAAEGKVPSCSLRLSAPVPPLRLAMAHAKKSGLRTPPKVILGRPLAGSWVNQWRGLLATSVLFLHEPIGKLPVPDEAKTVAVGCVKQCFQFSIGPGLVDVAEDVGQVADGEYALSIPVRPLEGLSDC